MNAAQDFFDNDEQGNRNHGFLRQSRKWYSFFKLVAPFYHHPYLQSKLILI